MKLHLGVVDFAYTGTDGSATTGDVAEWLEDDYHIMEVFFEAYRNRIGAWLADSLSDRIQDMADGAPVRANPFFDGEQEIERAFRKFLSTSEIERINPDTPTQAALEGRSKRKKQSTGPRRPSFIDTGQYMAAFRAWVES